MAAKSAARRSIRCRPHLHVKSSRQYRQLVQTLANCVRAQGAIVRLAGRVTLADHQRDRDYRDEDERVANAFHVFLLNKAWLTHAPTTRHGGGADKMIEARIENPNLKTGVFIVSGLSKNVEIQASRKCTECAARSS